jgi:hypothetical protein
MMFPQATSHGNILTFTPPGFSQMLSVKFPDSRLAVCEKCKKNFKTRDMCRVRNTHTSSPWTTAYICITIDDTCLDENGKYIDKPMTVRMVQWQPFCVKKPFDPKTPVCAACKRTNRTRSFCRERHKHRQLPWCTVYVLLSALDQTDPSTVVAGASKKVDGEHGDEEGNESAFALAQKPAAEVDEAGTKPKADVTNGGSQTIASDVNDEGDDINDIAESRTFLAKVSCRSTSINWLELNEQDVGEAAAFPPPMVTGDSQGYPGGQPGGDPNQAQYYSHAMGYTAQQHQNALKSQQQYFFQMQQRQQQQYAQAHWQHQYGHQMATPGQGEMTQQQGPNVTAGEAAAAASSRRNQTTPDEAQQQQQQQQWAMYYQQQQQQQQQGQYMPQQDGGMPMQGGMQQMQQGPPQEQYHDAHQEQEPEANGDSEDHEHDIKRQRVV